MSIDFITSVNAIVIAILSSSLVYMILQIVILFRKKKQREKQRLEIISKSSATFERFSEKGIDIPTKQDFHNTETLAFIDDDAAHTEILAPAQNDLLKFSRIVFLEIAGNASKRVDILRKPNSIIGRDKITADVLVEDRMVSRKHAQISFEHGKFYIQDLGSTNGTFIDNCPCFVEKLEVTESNIVKIGSTQFKIKKSTDDC